MRNQINPIKLSFYSEPQGNAIKRTNQYAKFNLLISNA
jgi:hypothetical protein